MLRTSGSSCQFGNTQTGNRRVYTSVVLVASFMSVRDVRSSSLSSRLVTNYVGFNRRDDRLDTTASGQVDGDKHRGLKKDRARRTGDYVKRMTSYKTDRRRGYKESKPCPPAPSPPESARS